MHKIERTLTSMEVAEMVEKEHSKLLKDIRRYIGQFGEAKIGFTDFFKESTYKTSQNKELPCYRITKKGCEFIAHKLTGIKGTIFTARYINRFHEMENILKEQQENSQPWFIRDFNGDKIMLFRDFKALTGIELFGVYTAWKRPDKLIGGRHYNIWGWKCDKKGFKEKYGFDYGDDDCMSYLYLCGIRKAIRAIENDMKDRKKLTPEVKGMILDGVMDAESRKKPGIIVPKKQNQIKENPVQITLVLNQNGICELR